MRKTTADVREVRPERGPTVTDTGFAGDDALDTTARALIAEAIGAPLVTFEGLSNNNNFALYGFRVNPPDPVGDLGPAHYVEMVNLAFAVYDKQGNLLTGPTRLGDLWAGFSVADCRDPSGDPIVVYDQLTDRWLLSQFTTRGPEFFNCVAISQTGDPTGAYHRYAFFGRDPFFPDYPKYGVWTDSYLLTSRDFGPHGRVRHQRVCAGEVRGCWSATPTRVPFSSSSTRTVVPINLIGDGLLPADLDGQPSTPRR